jgi:hypothetical protein
LAGGAAIGPVSEAMAARAMMSGRQLHVVVMDVVLVVD